MERLRRLTIPERTVAVRIDGEKCVGPLDCGECLKNCPASVFITYPRARERGKICDDWEISTDDTFCWGCKVCTEVCPEDAISIEGLEK